MNDTHTLVPNQELQSRDNRVATSEVGRFQLWRPRVALIGATLHAQQSPRLTLHDPNW